MTEPDPHLIYVTLSYVGVALVVAGLILWVAQDSRRQKARLARLEAQSRRSEPQR